MFHYNELQLQDDFFLQKKITFQTKFLLEKKIYFLLPSYEEDIQFNFPLLKIFFKLTNYL